MYLRRVFGEKGSEANVPALMAAGTFWQCVRFVYYYLIATHRLLLGA